MMNIIEKKLEFIDKQTTVKKKQAIIKKTDDLYIKNELDMRSKYIGINEFFPTPYNVCKIIRDMIVLPWNNPNMEILEPSAGTGSMCDSLLEVFPNWKKEMFSCCEINQDFIKLLKDKGYNVIGNDCLDIKNKSFDVIIMNPPFSAWKKHFLHCYDLLKQGGVLVCIISSGNYEQEKDLLEFMDVGVFMFDKDEFKYSGAKVQNCMLEIRR